MYYLKHGGFSQLMTEFLHRAHQIPNIKFFLNTAHFVIALLRTSIKPFNLIQGTVSRKVCK